MFAFGGCSSGSAVRDGAAEAGGDRGAADAPDTEETLVDAGSIDARGGDVVVSDAGDAAADVASEAGDVASDVAWTEGGSDTPGGDAGGAPALSFVTPDVMLASGEESTSCFYFHTPSGAALAIKRWTSSMDMGARELTLLGGVDSQPPDGTHMAGACSLVVGVSPWIYASSTASGELSLPSDDGAGHPLGMAIPAGNAMQLQVRYVNDGAGPMTPHVRVDGYALAPGTTFTQTDAFLAYNASLAIPPGGTNVIQSQSCTVPAGAKFWRVSTSTHKLAILSAIKDGTTELVSSTDWQNPQAKLWTTSPFFTFASGAMTYECTYDNVQGNTTVHAGQSSQTDEACIGIGYFFPSTGAKFCVDHTSL